MESRYLSGTLSNPALDQSLDYLNSFVLSTPQAAPARGSQRFQGHSIAPYSPYCAPSTPTQVIGLTDENVAQYIRAQTRAIELLLEEKDAVCFANQRFRSQTHHLEQFNHQLQAQVALAQQQLAWQKAQAAEQSTHLDTMQQKVILQQREIENFQMRGEDVDVGKCFSGKEHAEDALIANPKHTRPTMVDRGTAPHVPLSSMFPPREKRDETLRRYLNQVKELTVENARLAGSVSQLNAEVARERRSRATNVLRQLATMNQEVHDTCSGLRQEHRGLRAECAEMTKFGKNALHAVVAACTKRASAEIEKLKRQHEQELRLHAEAVEAHSKVLDLQTKQASELADLRSCFRRERARYVQQLLKVTASVEQGQTFIHRLENENMKLREKFKVHHFTTDKDARMGQRCDDGRHGHQLALGERTNQSSNVATTSATAVVCAQQKQKTNVERNPSSNGADEGASGSAGAGLGHGRSWKNVMAKKNTPTQQNYLKALDHLHKMLEQTKDAREAR